VRRRFDWHDKRQVLFLILGVIALVMIAGAGAAWVTRNNTLCSDGKPPVAQRAGILGQGLYRCHNGQIVTTPG
jgi:vancomycin permeability regulator SanA